MSWLYAGRYGSDAVLDAAGNAQPSASVRVRIAGTGTNATLYTDHTKATTTANPITPDSTGSFSFFVDPGEYDLVVTVGAATTTKRVVVAPHPYAANTVANVLAYGALGTGTGSGDRWAIQAAIDAVDAAGGGKVYMPAGTYIVESTIFVKSTTWLCGAGEGKTILKLKDNAGHDVIGTQAPNLQYMTLSDFSIDGNRDNNTAGRGIVLDTMFVQCSIRNVNVYLTSGRGIYIFDSDEFELRHVWVGNCDDTGIYLEDVSELRAYDVACERAHSTTAGAAQYVNIYLLRCDQSHLRSIGIEQTEGLTNGQGIGVHFDSCTTFSLDGMYAYGAGGAGSRADAVKITATDTPGRTYGYSLSGITKNNYNNSFNDTVASLTEPFDHLRYYADDCTPKTIQARDGNLYLTTSTRLQGSSGGDLGINAGNAKVGSTVWYFGGATPQIEANSGMKFYFNNQDSWIGRAGAANIVGTGGAFEMQEMTAPSAPGANKGRLFMQDNGAGKTQFCVLFPSGVAQVIATEP